MDLLFFSKSRSRSEMFPNISKSEEIPKIEFDGIFETEIGSLFDRDFQQHQILANNQLWSIFYSMIVPGYKTSLNSTSAMFAQKLKSVFRKSFDQEPGIEELSIAAEEDRLSSSCPSSFILYETYYKSEMDLESIPPKRKLDVSNNEGLNNNGVSSQLSLRNLMPMLTDFVKFFTNHNLCYYSKMSVSDNQLNCRGHKRSQAYDFDYLHRKMVSTSSCELNNGYSSNSFVKFDIDKVLRFLSISETTVLKEIDSTPVEDATSEQSEFGKNIQTQETGLNDNFNDSSSIIQKKEDQDCGGLALKFFLQPEECDDSDIDWDETDDESPEIDEEFLSDLGGGLCQSNLLSRARSEFDQFNGDGEVFIPLETQEERAEMLRMIAEANKLWNEFMTPDERVPEVFLQLCHVPKDINNDQKKVRFVLQPEIWGDNDE